MATANYVEDLKDMGWNQVGICCGSRRIFQKPDGRFVIVVMENGLHRHNIKSVGQPLNSKEAVQKAVHPALVEWHK